LTFGFIPILIRCTSRAVGVDAGWVSSWTGTQASSFLSSPQSFNLIKKLFEHLFNLGQVITGFDAQAFESSSEDIPPLRLYLFPVFNGSQLTCRPRSRQWAWTSNGSSAFVLFFIRLQEHLILLSDISLHLFE
jgi:hypothetical protein